MPDLLDELPLIPLNQLSRSALIGPRRCGRRLHCRTAQRWAMRGVAGVRLETIVQGGMRYTTAAAVRRFLAAVTAAREGRQRAGTPTRTSCPPSQVDAELRRLGI
jgi:Protein of unknown function (DUF1580)